METPYDLVEYPGGAFADTHPWRLAANGILRGMEPAPVTRSRVLEVGCGDGTNLLPMAYAFPESEFIGVDLARRPIERGQRAVADLGLGNLRLEARDLLSIGEGLGTFDYVIAHGVYSWVPANVRDGLMALCGRVLAPHGIAFISYLALPGTRLREMFRERMLAASNASDPPAERIARARAIMRMFSEGPRSPDAFRELARALAKETEELDDAAVFHDWLAPENAAFRVREFVDHARTHGLAFLGEAEFYVTQYRNDPHVAAARAELDRLDEEDPIGREQLLDDMRFRRFRQTLLCRGDVPLRKPTPTDIRRLALATNLRPEDPDSDPCDRTVATFVSPQGVHIRIDHPLTKAALLALHEAWPAAVPFEALAAGARERCDAHEGDVAAMAQALLSVAGAGHAELFAHPPALVARAGDRPRVSPVARWELTHRPRVTTLRHTALSVGDDMGRTFLELLDGTLDRAALARIIEERGLCDGAAGAGRVDDALRSLAEAGMLEA